MDIRRVVARQDYPADMQKYPSWAHARGRIWIYHWIQSSQTHQSPALGLGLDSAKGCEPRVRGQVTMAAGKPRTLQREAKSNLRLPTWVLNLVEAPLEALAMTQGADEVGGSKTEVHEVAETPSVALAVLVLATARLPEVRHGR